jgi:IMP cyclohydrolase
MYVGRIVSVAMTRDGRLCAMYRVSSRSFPNRTTVLTHNKVSIVPRPGREADIHKNPYIAYNCIRIVEDGNVAIVTNGSHTDPIAEKIVSGVPPRDAMSLSLLALDYEHDDFNTPRIGAVLDRRNGGGAWLGIVRQDGLEVCRMPSKPGHYYYVATYEENTIDNDYSGPFNVKRCEDACDFILKGGVFAERSNPVTAVAVMSDLGGFDLYAKDAAED